MRKWGDLQLALQLGFECNDHLRLIATQHIFMSVNVIQQVTYVKPYTYASHAI